MSWLSWKPRQGHRSAFFPLPLSPHTPPLPCSHRPQEHQIQHCDISVAHRPSGVWGETPSPRGSEVEKLNLTARILTLQLWKNKQTNKQTKTNKQNNEQKQNLKKPQIIYVCAERNIGCRSFHLRIIPHSIWGTEKAKLCWLSERGNELEKKNLTNGLPWWYKLDVKEKTLLRKKKYKNKNDMSVNTSVHSALASSLSETIHNFYSLR